MNKDAALFVYTENITMILRKISTGLLLFSIIVTSLTSCKVYRFKDVNIDPTIKTVKVIYFEAGRSTLNPVLSAQLSDRLRQKITSQTRLSQVQGDNANLEISGSFTDYSITTSGISNQQAASNRLTVSLHIIVKNRVEDKKSFEADVSRNFDFASSLSLEQAQSQLTSSIVQNMSDEIFNRIFSNW